MDIALFSLRTKKKKNPDQPITFENLHIIVNVLRPRTYMNTLAVLKFLSQQRDDKS